jgi:transmembrane sensor
MSTRRLNEEAARWAQRLEGPELTEAEHAAFCAWIEESAKNERAFVGQMMLDVLTSELPRAPALKRARWRTFQPRSERGPTWWPRVALLFAGASVVISALAFLILQHSASVGHTYSTAAGELREVHLDDGSVAYLNTRTTLRFRGDTRQRSADLLDGEVLFAVRPEPGRPFIVTVDTTQIRVTGTQFNVYRRHFGRHHDVCLSVLAGTVEVSGPGSDPTAKWHRQLQANQEITYSPSGIVSDIQAAPVEKSITWRSQILEAENIALSDVIAELSRYTTASIVLADPRLSNIRIVATLDVRSIANALNQLQALAPIRVEQSGKTFILHYRADPPETVSTTSAEK